MAVSKLTRPWHPFHIPEADVAWGDYIEWYPDGSMPGMRAKRIIGPGGAVEDAGTMFGLLEMDPGAVYPAHRHAAAEVYYVIEGEAECTWGEETFTVGPGSMIRTPPGEWHAFRNYGDGIFRAVAYWYGDAAALAALLELKDG